MAKEEEGPDHKTIYDSKIEYDDPFDFPIRSRHINEWDHLEWVEMEDNIIKTEVMINGNVYEVFAFVDGYRPEEDRLQVIDVVLLNKKLN